METTNSLSVSKFLSLTEALNQHKNYTIDDLYNAASEDKLPIYIRCEMWKIYSVVSIKREFANLLHDSSDANLSKIFPDLLKVLEKGDETEIINMLVEMSDAMEELKNFRPNQEIPESISNGVFKGLFTIYPYEGIYKAIYSMPLFDFKPISPLTFGICLKGFANPSILLMADNLISNSTDYFFISIDVGAEVALTLNDDIKDNKLFVKAADILSLKFDDKFVKADDDQNILPETYIPAKSPSDKKVGLSTTDIAIAFDGLNDWNILHWKSTLANVPKWLSVAQVQKGKKGAGKASLWNPALLAKQLYLEKGIHLAILKKTFREQSSLHPWKEEWKSILDEISE